MKHISFIGIFDIHFKRTSDPFTVKWADKIALRTAVAKKIIQ